MLNELRGLRWFACQLPLACCLTLTGCAGSSFFTWGNNPTGAEASAGDAQAGAGRSRLNPFAWFEVKGPAPTETTAAASPPDSGKSWLKPASWFDKKKADQPADSLVLRGDQVESAAVADTGPAATDLAAAHELYRQEQYSAAGKAFKRIAGNTGKDYFKPRVAEEARFYEAESYRREEYYKSAADTYYRMMTDFPNGAHREQACQRMFDIANYWLEDTRTEMEAYKEQQDGQRWFVVSPVVHLERSKPFLDEEGHALQTLERVHLNDIRGPLADRSLFLIATVKFYREDYPSADQYFSQLVEMYPNSKLAPRALELGIIAKQMSTGGPDYDGRKVAQARRLINSAFASYPDLAADKREFLEKQLASCNLQQAEKDFKIAEFYRRTGQPGSAYFYYEIVRRRYPGTDFFDKATERMHEVRAAAEAKEKAAPPPEEPPATDTLPAPQPVPEEGTLPAPRPLPGTGLTPGAPLEPNGVPPAGAPNRFPMQPGAAQPVPRPQ
jgi:outer membrane protein assembly factor BamD (BamD/ComL family)